MPGTKTRASQRDGVVDSLAVKPAYVASTACGELQSAATPVQYWLQFFVEAGIPSTDAGTYAAAFVSHRITPAMLPDLNKVYLNDMGVRLVGDVIAILQHAQNVHGAALSRSAFQRAGLALNVAGAGAQIPAVARDLTTNTAVDYRQLDDRVATSSSCTDAAVNCSPVPIELLLPSKEPPLWSTRDELIECSGRTHVLDSSESTDEIGAYRTL